MNRSTGCRQCFCPRFEPTTAGSTVCATCLHRARHHMPTAMTDEAVRPVAIAAGDVGQLQASAAAHETWKASAADAVRYVARTNAWFTAAHVRDRLSAVGATTENLSALGPIMRIGTAEGLARKTTRTWVAPGVTYHNSKPLPVWRSLVHRGQKQPLPTHCRTCKCEE